MDILFQIPQPLLSQYQTLSNSQLYQIALLDLQNPDSLQNALLIFYHIPQEHQNIYSLLLNQFINFLLHSNPDICNIALALISNLINKKYDFQSLFMQIVESLLDIIRWDFSLKSPQQAFEYATMLQNAPFPDLHNFIKILEPKSFNKYYFINREDINIFGLLKALQLFLSHNCIYQYAIELIEIIQRVARHQNEYVRLYALKFIHYLVNFQRNQIFEELIHATLLAGLMDESLEIRFQALNELKHLNPQDKDQLFILLYNHIHCDDLKKVSEIISQQFFPIQQELLNIIHQKKLNECIIHCFYSTISRNWKMRRSGLKTLLSIVQHCPIKDLPLDEILKVAQNCTLFETDFNVQYYGFSLMYQIIILDQSQITKFSDQIIQNCLFHFSDDSQECQELCSKILVILISHQNLIQELLLKTDLITNKELAQKDLKQQIKIMQKFQNQGLQQSFQEEINEEKIIKHQLNLLLGIISCFIQIIKFKFDEKTLHQVIQMICQGLQIKILQQDVVYKFLLNELKQIQMQQKELVKNLIIRSNLIETLQQNNKIEVIRMIDEILLGTPIFKE